MNFEWHPPKAKSNLEWHGVAFEEAATVFEDPLVDIQPDLKHSLEEERFAAVARRRRGGCLS